MTDRVKGFTVAMKDNIRVDDAEGLRDAIRMLRGVVDVQDIAHTTDDWIAWSRFRCEFGEKIRDMLYPPKERA